MLELWLVCHGETPWNREGRALGQSDPPLSELGVRQAELLAQRLAGVSFSEVYSSDLARARYTARLCLPAAEIRLEPRLREVKFGRWEGQRWQDMGGEEKRALDLWRQDPYRSRAPGGESYEDVLERVSAWIAELPKEGRVIAFAHGGSIRCALYTFTGLPENSTWRFQIDTGSITRLLLGPQGAVLQGINDTALLV
jgi:broad specificity phosphatase PhoE